MKNPNAKNWIGIALIVVGTIFIIDNLDLFSFHLRPIFFSWPVILIIIGAIILINSKNSTAGIILIIIGLFGSIGKFFYFSLHEFIWDYWPILLIALGLLILYRRKEPDHGKKILFEKGEKKNFFDETHHRHNYTYESTNTISEDYINITSILKFGGEKKSIRSENFRGGKITSIYGWFDVDLTNSKLAEGEQEIDVVILFGESKIYVPQNWNVIINIKSIFGGFSDERRFFRADSDEKQEGILILKGFTIFGGGALKS